MRKRLLVVLIIALLAFSAWAKSNFTGINKIPDSRIVDKHYRIVHLPSGESRSYFFRVPSEGEYALAIYAKAPDTDWCSTQSTSSLIKVTTPSMTQTLVTYLGSKPSVYRISLGRLAPPGVTVTLKVERAPYKVKIYGVALEKLPDDVAYKYSPVIAYKKGFDHTDTPLLMYYERKELGDELRLDYYVIFSNEDWGTPAEKLMSLWGHLSDIEWVSSVWLRKGADKPYLIKYQAVMHTSKEFKGLFLAGEHPLLKVASDNNNFSDEASPDSPLIAMYPVPKDFEGTREEMQDKYPWIYTIVSCELFREGKLEETPNPDTVKPSDLRNYVFVDLKAPKISCGALSLQAKLKGSDKWYSSDHGLQNLAVTERGEYLGDGWIRFAIEVPKGTKLEDVEALRIKYYYLMCPPKVNDAKAEVTYVKKVMMLNDRYEPLERKLNLRKRITLTPDTPIYELSLK